MQHLGRECEFVALGRTWKAARQTRRVLIEFADWARPQVPNPVRSALEEIDLATAADAEAIRELRRLDLIEDAKAKQEKREPVLMLPLYQPLANTMLQEAQRRKDSYKDINYPEILSLLNSLKGQAYLFYLLLRRNHPDATEAQVDDILDELHPDEIKRILRVTAGEGRPSPKNDQAPAA